MKAADALRNRLGGNMRESVIGAGSAPTEPEASGAVPQRNARHDGAARMRDALSIDLARLVPDPDQPRREFDPVALEDLAASIKARGLLQPLLVRWDEGQGVYVLIAGERRYRAATKAGLTAVPCVEYKGPVDPTDRLEVQLIENALREDLSPVEQANAFRSLMDARGWTYRDLAGNLHIALSSVARAMALLELPVAVQEQVERGELPATTAAELVKLGDADAIAGVAAEVAQGGLSRAETVKRVRQAAGKGKAKPKVRGAALVKQRVVRTTAGKVTVDLRKAGGAAEVLAALREAVAVLEGEQGAAAA